MSGGFTGGVNEFLTGADTAPVPQVSSYPPAREAPKTWVAPDVSAQGEIVVHRDRLTAAADMIKNHLPELDAAVQNLEKQLNAFTSLAGWEAGDQIRRNLEDLARACAKYGQRVSNANEQAAEALIQTTTTYQQVEDSNAATAKTLGGDSPGAAASGSSGPASGGWS